jgi:hypothetical protein
MRTTLSIDDDVLNAAKELADRQQRTIGEVISALARQGMRPETSAGKMRNGILLLPVRPEAKPVTLELVNELRDELPG